jgi:hypothetical protein
MLRVYFLQQRFNLSDPGGGCAVWIAGVVYLSIDELVARSWKAQEGAPALCSPMLGGPLAYWKEAFALCERLLEALHPALEGLDVENVIYPHFISGPLDLGQRLEFRRFHMDRHLGQIERVKQTPGFYP